MAVEEMEIQLLADRTEEVVAEIICLTMHGLAVKQSLQSTDVGAVDGEYSSHHLLIVFDTQLVEDSCV